MTVPTPQLERLLETALYVSDLAAAREFYEGVLGCTVMLETPRLVSLSIAGQSVLLLFPHSMPNAPIDTPNGVIPGHGASGVQHIAFAIARDSLDAWLDRLDAAGVTIESRVTWERGGQSVYFRDPDGHSLELLTPGLWPIY